jgi:hypothetical protein
MKETSPSISAMAVMIYCKTTKKGCKCTIAEQSQSAGSYRGEILRGGNSTYLRHGSSREDRPIPSDD